VCQPIRNPTLPLLAAQPGHLQPSAGVQATGPELARRAMENLPEGVDAWSTDDVVVFFESLRLVKYCEAVRDEGISGSMLKYLIEHDGLGDLGLSKLEQARLVNSVKARSPANAGADTNVPASPSKGRSAVEAGKGAVGATQERAEEEMRAKLEADMRAAMEEKMKAEVKASLEARMAAEMKTKMEAEMREAAEKQRKQTERAEAESQARAEAEAQAKQEADRKRRLAAEKRARAEAKAEAEQEQFKLERERAEAEARARQEVEMRAQLEAEMRTKVEAEVKAKVEAQLGGTRLAEAAAAVPVPEEQQPAAASVAGAAPAPPPEDAQVPKLDPEAPILDAVRSGDEAMLCSLLAKRADPNSLDDFGGPLLDLAISCKSHSMAALLLSARADPQAASVDMPRNDGVMFELLSNSNENMGLDTSFFLYHKSDEWREARQLLMWAKGRINGEESAAAERRRAAEEEAAEARAEAEVETARRRREEESRLVAQFKPGDKVRLNEQGCDAPPSYDWSAEVLRPGDVGEVLSCRVLRGELDVFLRGPRGRTESYLADDLERAA